MQFNTKIRRHGEHIISSRLLRSLNDKDIDALDELIKAGPAGILSIALRDKIGLGGQPAPYIRHLRLAGFRIHTEDKTLHHYRGDARVCGRYILLSIPHVSMLPDVFMDQSEPVEELPALVAAAIPIQVDLFSPQANDAPRTEEAAM